jgi:hypothetical protein
MDQYDQYQGNSQGNPYDFILNPDQPKKQRKMLGGGNSFIRTIIFIVAGTITLLIVAAIIINALAPKKVTDKDLISLAQTQAEMMRISNQAGTQAKQQTTRNLASTVQYTMATQQKQTVDKLAAMGVKVQAKQLALKQDATTDQKFTTAKATSTYDQTYTEIIQEQLTAYANTLKSLNDIASASERDRLSDYYQQTQLLISQVPYAQERIESPTGTPVP